MAAGLLRWFAWLVLALPFIPVVAVDADNQEIERLVKQLWGAEVKMR